MLETSLLRARVYTCYKKILQRGAWHLRQALLTLLSILFLQTWFSTIFYVIRSQLINSSMRVYISSIFHPSKARCIYSILMPARTSCGILYLRFLIFSILFLRMEMNWFLVTLILSSYMICRVFIRILASVMHSKSRKVFPFLQLSQVLLQFSGLKSFYPRQRSWNYLRQVALSSQYLIIWASCLVENSLLSLVEKSFLSVILMKNCLSILRQKSIH